MARKAKVKKINHEEMLERIRSYRSNKNKIKELEKKCDEDKAAVIAVMTEFSISELEEGDLKATYKERNTSSFNKEKFNEDYPGVYEQYVVHGVTKSFAVSAK
ncbi:MAG: hypothetical protein IJ446_09080 [Oscillospiraceae bacterium]|nr:hypothetical protein [Oscillospiraceae bacterium]